MITERGPVSAVADPSPPARVRRLLTCPPSAGRRGLSLPGPLAPSRLLRCALLAAAVIAVITGRGLGIVLVLALAAFVVRKVAARAAPSKTAARYRRRDRGRFVDPSCIDRRYRGQLARAQQAIRDVLQSRVYRDGVIDNALSEAILADHEWEIACLLRDATALRAQSALIVSAPGAAHPAVQAILAQHAEVLRRAGRAVGQRIRGLEANAAEVPAADGEYTTWQLTAAGERLNDQFLDLLARAPANGRAGQISRLAAEARAWGEAFHGLTTGPDAASPLALPGLSRSETA